jgi:hypothetical protein
VWWEYVIIVAILILGIYGFRVLTGFETRTLTRKSNRTAESLYDNYTDSGRRRAWRPMRQAGRRDDDEHAGPR